MNPINAHCKNYLNYLMKLKAEEIEEEMSDHDCGDEDPNAWSED